MLATRLNSIARISRLSRSNRIVPRSTTTTTPTVVSSATTVVPPRGLDSTTIDKIFGASDTIFTDDTSKSTFLQMVCDPAVIDITFDVGKNVTVHYQGNEPSIPLPSATLTPEHVRTLWSALDAYGDHDRGGVTGSSNRWSCLRNFEGSVVGVTLRLSRNLDIHTVLQNDLKGYLALGNSVILFGPPGSGKTTMLRCISEYLADHVPRRVLVVDESGELGGFGDVPRGIGGARRVCVHGETTYHDEIRNAIRNHSPHVLIVDELMSRDDVTSAMAAAARGVQLVATCHANSIRDLVNNPLISDLVGGQQHAAVTDTNASKSGGKFVAGRKTLPAFRGAYSIGDSFLYPNLSNSVDSILRSTM